MKSHIKKLSEIEPKVDKGGEVYVMLSPKNVGMENLIMGLAITPIGKNVVEHVHNYSEECFFVIQGSGKVHLEDGEEIVFSKDSAVRVPKGVKHWIENTGDEDIKVVFSSAPLAPTHEKGHKNFK
jgi:putative monooxygenase